jgi:hypothetical protein
MSKRIRPAALLALGTVGAAAAAHRCARSALWAGESLDGFFAWDGPSEQGVDVGSAVIDLPIRYYRDDCFMGVFTASADAVRALLPSDRLHPVRSLGGKALVAVVAWNYLETTVGPYGEVGIAPLCTLDRPAPPLVGGLREAVDPGFGGFVLHLPVTARVARDAGRAVWGYPKFVADMEFDHLPGEQRVHLSEGGRTILSLAVRHGGRAVTDNRPLSTFTVLDGRLVQTTVPTRAVYELGVGRRAGELELGDHPIADQLRGLELSTRPMFTKNYLARAGILPRGTALGPAARYEGYRGEDHETGLLSVRYDDSLAAPAALVRPRQGAPA